MSHERSMHSESVVNGKLTVSVPCLAFTSRKCFESFVAPRRKALLFQKSGASS